MVLKIHFMHQARRSCCRGVQLAKCRNADIVLSIVGTLARAQFGMVETC